MGLVLGYLCLICFILLLLKTGATNSSKVIKKAIVDALSK